jgi:dolichol-phosphate mannosyltransferase
LPGKEIPAGSIINPDQENTTMQISIVIPVHNEEGNIGCLLTEIHSCLGRNTTYEIICVDDHSTDNTAGAIAEKAESIPEVHCIHLVQQSGQSCALRKGVEAARASLIISLDGDGQNDPADIATFLDVCRKKNIQKTNYLLIGHRKQRQDSQSHE